MSDRRYSFGDIDRVFEQIARVPYQWTPDKHELAKLRERFLAVGPWTSDHRFTTIEVLKGLTEALHRELWGLWFDYTEDYLLEERCNQFIGYRVGRPDAYWVDPENYTNFVWAGEGVDTGLFALDQWLITNQREHLAREELDFYPGLRLIEIDTGGDDLLSMACYHDYVEAAIEALAEVGIRSRWQSSGQSWMCCGAPGTTRGPSRRSVS